MGHLYGDNFQLDRVSQMINVLNPEVNVLILRPS